MFKNPFSENRAVYEMMWKNIVERGMQQMTIWRMRIACWIPTVTHTTRSVNKVMRLIQYKSVLTLKLQMEFVPFKIVPLGGYTTSETLFPLFVATLVVANRNGF